jgi:hypothetical protein
MDPKFANVFTIRKILRKHQLNLLEELLTNVYPQLPAEEQAKVLMQIMPYVYTKPKAKEISKKKNRTVLTELPKAKDPKQPSVAQLLQLAKMNESNGDKK